MPVNSVQFWRTMWLFNNQTFLTCNMSQPFFSDIKMHQCHLTTFRTCSPLVLLPSSIIFTIVSPPRQFRILILKLHLQLGFHSFVSFTAVHIFGHIIVQSIWAVIPRRTRDSGLVLLNLNSITKHSYVQISLLKAHLSIHKFHIPNLFVRNITRPSVPLHGANLERQGYELVPSEAT